MLAVLAEKLFEPLMRYSEDKRRKPFLLAIGRLQEAFLKVLGLKVLGPKVLVKGSPKVDRRQVKPCGIQTQTDPLSKQYTTY